MSPEELWHAASEVTKRCRPDGVASENAAVFIQDLMAHLRGIGGWLPPVYGTVGYADNQLVDLLRQLKFHSEIVLVNFPQGAEALSLRLETFCQYLQTHYPVSKERIQNVGDW